MKIIIQIGKPVHLQVKSVARAYTACWLIGGDHLTAWDPRDVECERCKKTRAYKEAMVGRS